MVIILLKKHCYAFSEKKKHSNEFSIPDLHVPRVTWDISGCRLLKTLGGCSGGHLHIIVNST